MKDGKKDIWTESIKCIMGATKKSLLDFVDALDKNNLNHNLREIFGLIKGRVHNDVSQATLNLGILMENMKVGGNISAFIKNDDNEPWAMEIKNIIMDAKESLKNFTTAIFKQKDERNMDDFDLIVRKIDTNMNRTVINIGILFSTFKNGGDISAFESNIRRKDNNTHESKPYFKKQQKIFNPINMKQ